MEEKYSYEELLEKYRRLFSCTLSIPTRLRALRSIKEKLTDLTDSDSKFLYKTICSDEEKLERELARR
jgi:hypothetical protein